MNSQGRSARAKPPRIVEVGAIALALVLAAFRAVSWPVAIGSAVLSLVWPPQLAPGFGLIVVVIALVVAKNRGERSARRDEARDASSSSSVGDVTE
jgi:hypothetical protein